RGTDHSLFIYLVAAKESSRMEHDRRTHNMCHWNNFWYVPDNSVLDAIKATFFVHNSAKIRAPWRIASNHSYRRARCNLSECGDGDVSHRHRLGNSRPLAAQG